MPTSKLSCFFFSSIIPYKCEQTKKYIQKKDIILNKYLLNQIHVL